MHELLKNFIQWLSKQWFSKNTVENYWRGVMKFTEFLVANEMNYNCWTRGIEMRKDSLDCWTRTANLYLNAVRKLYFYLNYMGFNYVNPKNILLFRETRREMDYITKWEYSDFFDVDSDTLKTLRSKTICKILWETWVRVWELIEIKWSDFKRDINWVFIKVIWKWDKERIICFSDELVELLLQYRSRCLEEWIKSEYVVCSFANNCKWAKTNRNTVEKIIRDLNKTWKHITPHSFRHWFATHCLQHWCNIVDLQKVLGHANLSTTSTYLHSDNARMRKCQSLCW